MKDVECVYCLKELVKGEAFVCKNCKKKEWLFSV